MRGTLRGRRGARGAKGAGSAQKAAWRRRPRRCSGATPSTATSRSARSAGQSCRPTPRSSKSSRSCAAARARWGSAWPSSGMTSTGATTPSSAPCWRACSPPAKTPTSTSPKLPPAALAEAATRSLFESGINWGRVIALLAFGYRMAMHVWQRGVSGFLRRIARYVGDFMLQNRIARWIAQQGGWEAVQNLDNVYMKYMLVAAVAVLGYLVLRRFFTPCTP
ncbi:bcl-2 homologous antagonist/killer isoform X1 [Vidua chalybeata]|uniref:bcl-2 homologous antagonist/killer isoform X1 n=1 Tax=Vidua chalybeata TaxID=81927 RepID=UPI0023A7CEE8|nr:bcl-2 homologous antagonist/killer isoform X1 [Vidua chalybeata]